MADLGTPDLCATPGQTVGPFFHYALPFPGDRELVPPGSPGAVLLHGHVRDGAGEAVPDALVEIRQADATGTVPAVEGSLRRAGSPFTGWGRCSSDRTGRWWFSTVEPAPTQPGGAAFFAVTVFARGLLDRLSTRIYLPGDDAALAADPLLAGLDPDDRARMVAVRDPGGSLRLDLYLQGPHESVFLTYPGHGMSERASESVSQRVGELSTERSEGGRLSERASESVSQSVGELSTERSEGGRLSERASESVSQRVGELSTERSEGGRLSERASESVSQRVGELSTERSEGGR